MGIREKLRGHIEGKMVDKQSEWIRYRAGQGPKPTFAKMPITMPDKYYDRIYGLERHGKTPKEVAKELRTPRISKKR